MLKRRPPAENDEFKHFKADPPWVRLSAWGMLQAQRTIKHLAVGGVLLYALQQDVPMSLLRALLR